MRSDDEDVHDDADGRDGSTVFGASSLLASSTCPAAEFKLADGLAGVSGACTSSSST